MKYVENMGKPVKIEHGYPAPLSFAYAICRAMCFNVYLCSTSSSFSYFLLRLSMRQIYDMCSLKSRIVSIFVELGNLPVERAKDTVWFLQWCGVSLVSSYAVCFLQKGGVSLASSAIIYNIVKVKVTQ